MKGVCKVAWVQKPPLSLDPNGGREADWRLNRQGRLQNHAALRTAYRHGKILQVRNHIERPLFGFFIDPGDVVADQPYSHQDCPGKDNLEACLLYTSPSPR